MSNIHQEFAAPIERARHEFGAKVGNNTRIRRVCDDLVVHLHNTDIVTIKPDGSLILTMNGWNTVTTRERINQFTERLGVRLFSQKGIPYLCKMGDWENKVPYKDGVRIYPGGRITGGGTVNNVNAAEKMRTRVRKYAKDYLTAFQAGKVPAPSAGDCFFCQMRDVNTKQPIRQADHMLAHMKERYFVPSMLANANDRVAFPQASIAPVMLWALGAKWHPDATEREKMANVNHMGFVFNNLRKNLVKWIEWNLAGGT